MDNPQTLTQRISQTEKALQAVLDQHLTEAGITFMQWVILTFLARQGAFLQQDSLMREIASVLKSDATTVWAALNTLNIRGLVYSSPESDGRISLTAEGTLHFQNLRQRIEDITERLAADVPANDLAITYRVLDTITERANAELAHRR
jgi:DNA-binding MarR family transcriptional regulator